jgi:hypothetical protein
VKRNEIEFAYNNTIKELEESLDKYMKNLPESPLSLPIKTKLVIVRKNHTIDHVMLHPTDNLNKLNDLVNNYFTNIGDEIVNRDENCGYYIIRKEYETDINSELKEVSKEIKINENSIALSIGLLPGESIYFMGEYKLKSDAPKVCIKVEFEKMKGSSVNYFSCENCKLNCKNLYNPRAVYELCSLMP